MLVTGLKNVLEGRPSTGTVLKNCYWVPDNRERLKMNDQTEEMLSRLTGIADKIYLSASLYPDSRGLQNFSKMGKVKCDRKQD